MKKFTMVFLAIMGMTMVGSGCTLFEDGSVRGDGWRGCFIPELGCDPTHDPLRHLAEDDEGWDCTIDGDRSCTLAPPLLPSHPIAP